jgi:CMP-N,N'-diacetyllegionaminic acid synthase
MKIASLITARGGSKGIPYKNIKPINGKPLISYSIIQSLKSKVDETWVSTDDVRIKDVSLEYGAKVIDRPKELSGDVIMPDDSIVHFAESVDFDWVIFIQPTSPLIKSKYIDIGIEMIKSGEYDSVFTATKEHWLPRWNKNIEPIDWNIYKRPRRQDKPELYTENGMFYITNREQLLKSKLRYSGRMGVVEIPLIDSFQLDSIADLELIRKII